MVNRFMKNFLVISKNKKDFLTIYSCFHPEHSVDQVQSIEQALGLLKQKRRDFIFIDLELLRLANQSSNSYKTVLKDFWYIYPSIQVIVMTPQDLIREAVMAVKSGASNYLTYPLESTEILHVTEGIYESLIVQSELDYLRDQFWEVESLSQIHTMNPEMQKVFNKIRSVTKTKSTVLLIGETGTGKGVLASIIHKHSNRRHDQFISVHCGAIPETLLESELFGHEKGAFTGAIKRKLGKFEIAQNGTIFLDEISTITLSAQIKLLQILQEKTLIRVGGEESVEINARIISATNSDLKNMCDEGLFRKDLYFRLNVFPIEIPPLRERKEDIPHLAGIFLERLNAFHLKDIKDIHPAVMEGFDNYSWPGNIRELENLIERSYILETSSILTPESFPPEIFVPGEHQPRVKMVTSSTLKDVRQEGVEQVERIYLKELLTENKGRIKTSAEVAGISTRQLSKLMKKYGLRKEEFKST